MLPFCFAGNFTTFSCSPTGDSAHFSVSPAKQSFMLCACLANKQPHRSVSSMKWGVSNTILMFFFAFVLFYCLGRFPLTLCIVWWVLLFFLYSCYSSAFDFHRQHCFTVGWWVVGGTFPSFCRSKVKWRKNTDYHLFSIYYLLFVSACLGRARQIQWICPPYGYTLNGECQTEWGVVWWRKQSTKKHKNTGSPKRQGRSLTTCTALRSRIGTRFHFICSSSPLPISIPCTFYARIPSATIATVHAGA